MSAPKPWRHGRAALLYSGMGRKLVLQLKHADRQEIAKPAALWMQSAVSEMAQTDTLLAPVPLHWLRLAKRKYNQSALIAAQLSAISGLDMCPDLLERPLHTPSLDGKSKGERAGILSDAIRVRSKRKSILHGRHVILIDDVMTTGATLSACTEACRAAGASEVCVAVLARVTRDT